MKELATFWVCWFIAIGSWAQNADLFDRQQRTFDGQGWSWSIGAAGLIAQPQQASALWLTAQGDGSIDTLHSGIWVAEGQIRPRLGIGYWRVMKRAILFDRIAASAGITQHRASSTFVGMIAQTPIGGTLRADTLTDTARSNLTVQTALHGYRAIEIIPDFFIEGHVGIGWDIDMYTKFDRTGPDSLFVPLKTNVPWRLALEGGLGLGVRTRSGRFLRLMFNTDWLQLIPVGANGGAAMDWMSGHYRPWNASLTWDIMRRKPAESCVGTPEGQPGKDLFGPKMRKKARWFKRRR